MQFTFFRFLAPLAAVAFAMLVCVPTDVSAQTLDISVNENILTIPKKGALFTIELETSVYKPDGDGPFPLVVINHGKANGDPRFQSRYKPIFAIRWFLQRGYVVVVPMRQGFSKSTGSYIGGGCNVESNGRAQAEDVKAVLDYFVTQPYVDRTHMLLMGQSHGGWTTLAFGALTYPGVKGLVNFAGGLRQESCSSWESVLATAAGSYAKQTTLPSLWFYGDNDSYFSRSTWTAMAERYTAAGGKARVIPFGAFASDAHTMFGSREGQKIWQPEVAVFLQQLGLPSEPRKEFEKYAHAIVTSRPPKTDFAALDDTVLIPFLRDTGRDGYRDFLARPIPRAFAIAPNGAWSFAEGGEEPITRALQNCNSRGKDACKLYAVDKDVVWTSP